MLYIVCIPLQVQGDSITEDNIACFNISTHRCQMCNVNMYEGWNFNSGNYLFTTDTK